MRKNEAKLRWKNYKRVSLLEHNLGILSRNNNEKLLSKLAEQGIHYLSFKVRTLSELAARSCFLTKPQLPPLSLSLSLCLSLSVSLSHLCSCETPLLLFLFVSSLHRPPILPPVSSIHLSSLFPSFHSSPLLCPLLPSPSLFPFLIASPSASPSSLPLSLLLHLICLSLRGCVRADECWTDAMQKSRLGWHN